MVLKPTEDPLERQTILNAEEFEALAEYAGIGLLKMDIPTGAIFLNRPIVQLTGYEPGDMPHTENTKKMLTFDDDWKSVNRCMESIMSGETNRYQLEYRMRRKDGSIAAISENMIVCTRDEKGNPVNLAGVCLDLSRLRWAEEKARNMEKEVKRLAQSASDSELAEQNRLLRAANMAAVIIIGGFHQDYETVLRQSLQILAESIQADHACIWRNIHKDGKLGCFSRVQWAKDGAAQSMEKDVFLDYDDILPNWKKQLQEYSSLSMLAEDIPSNFKLPGAEQFKSVLISPLYLNGEFWGLLGLSSQTRDTLYTKDESEIITSGAMVIAASLSRNEVFNKLNEAREKAMSSVRAKGEFLSRMSHEIRTPMNAIIGMTMIAKKTEDPQRIRYCLDKIDASSRQLLSLINDVLDMSKIDSGKLEIVRDEFDFEHMMQYVSNIIQVKLNEKNQDFRVEFSSVFTRAVISDELRLSQVMINLLTNAIKFTPHGGKISLNILEEPVDNRRSLLRFEIVDNGIGISPEQQAKLFRAFEQGDGSITRAYGGTGLGLVICKKIVNLLGGNIWVESALGQGSHFCFEIEVEWGQDLFANLISQDRLKKLRILVVDDVDDVREYFMNVLESFSVDCDTASNGDEAIRAVKASINDQTPYDMVFIDWHLPGMNGGKTAAEIRRLMNNNNIIVVIISIADWHDIEDEAKEYGITHYLTKPVMPSRLYNTIVKLCNNSLVTSSPPEQKKTEDWSGLTILLAEDIEINQEIVQSILEETGIEIICACNGQKAVQLFSSSPERFDLILMDVQMPHIDGLQATKLIRAIDHPWASQIPILAMTANAFKEDAKLCLEAGMNDHVAKPIDVGILFRKLSIYLGAGKHARNKQIKDETEQEYLDVQEGLVRMGGNIALYQKLLDKFLSNTRITELEYALEQSDTATALDIAHTIKGITGNLSLKALYKKVSDLEKMLKKNETVHGLDEIKNCVEKTTHLIKQKMHSFDAGE